MRSKRWSSAFAKAEAGFRQVVLQLGLGAVGFVFGSLISAGALTRISERLVPQTELVISALGWLFQRLWLFTLVPLFGYGVGRLTQIKPAQYALLAPLCGETFSVLLASAVDGFEPLVGEPLEVLARLATLVAGMAMSHLAVRAGRADGLSRPGAGPPA